MAIYKSHAEAEAAIKELQQSGFDMKKLSIVGRDYHTDEHVVGYYNAGDRMKYWGKRALSGVAFGDCCLVPAFFRVPGVGQILVAGPLVAWIVGALEGAIIVGGLSAIGAGLYSLGIPKDSIVRYETALKSGKYILIAHGTPEETTRAHDIIQGTNTEASEHHDLPINDAAMNATLSKPVQPSASLAAAKHGNTPRRMKVFVAFDEADCARNAEASIRPRCSG